MLVTHKVLCLVAGILCQSKIMHSYFSEATRNSPVTGPFYSVQLSPMEIRTFNVTVSD